MDSATSHGPRRAGETKSTDEEPALTPPAMLLAQLGAHAADRFAERIAHLNLTPPQVGLLRWIQAAPGRSQQAIADHFGIQPSRVVVFVDQLEERGLVWRGRDHTDRRIRAVRLTERGERLMDEVQRAASEHETELFTALSAAERAELVQLLGRIAEQQGMAPGVHPRYHHVRD